MGMNKMLEKALAGTAGSMGEVLGRILELLEEQNVILKEIRDNVKAKEEQD